MPEVCDSLPSADSAASLVRGERNALPRVIVHTLGRSAVIGIGLAIAGQRENLIRNAQAGGIAIEVFVLAYQYSKRINV